MTPSASCFTNSTSAKAKAALKTHALQTLRDCHAPRTECGSVTRSNLNRQHAIDLSENDSAQHIAAGHRPALRSGPRMHLFAWSLVLAALLFAGNLFGQTNF